MCHPGLPRVCAVVEMAAHVTLHPSISVRHQQMMVEQTAANTVIVATVNFLATLQ